MSLVRSELIDVSSEMMSVQWFKHLLHDKSELNDVWYCTNIDMRISKAQKSLSLFTSLIWSFKGDCLSEMRMCISELHWSYMYKAEKTFKAFFAMHWEDDDLLFINYLYEGDKYWTVILEN